MNPDLQGRVRIKAGKLTISRISLLDSGMYQCVAQNEHGSIHASAELKVVGKQMTPPSSHTVSGGEGARRVCNYWNKGASSMNK